MNSHDQAHSQGSRPSIGLKERKRVGAPLVVACVMAAGVLGGGAAVGMQGMWNGGTTVSTTATTAQFTPVIVNNTDSVNAVTAAAQKATPSVVTISATSANAAGTGSGIILDTAGHILTNTHVVTLDGQSANAAIEVRTSNGAVYPGTIVGTDPQSDLAIVQITADGLVPATLGDSASVKVGDTAIAIGAPLGLSGTVTDGIISAADRTIDIASSAASGSSSMNSSTQASISINVIQTDAAINPGNSGGALANTQGEIIGVNVAIASVGSSASAQAGNIGVGFAIPINDAKRVAQEIIATGK
jgi:putative serine protease PepD